MKYTRPLTRYNGLDDQQLIQTLELLYGMTRTATDDGIGIVYTELGKMLEVIQNRPNVIEHYRKIRGVDSEMTHLCDLVLGAPPPQQTDSPGCFLSLFSRQKRKFDQWGRGGKK